MIEEIFCDNPIIIEKIKYKYFDYDSRKNILKFYINEIDWGYNQEFVRKLFDNSIGKRLVINNSNFSNEFINTYSKYKLYKFINNIIKSINIIIDYTCYHIIGADSPSCAILGYYVNIEFV